MSDDQRGDSRFLHPIPEGWIAARGSVGGPNYDEFVDDSDIASVLKRRPDSVVALDLPQHTQEATREDRDFLASLPLAASHLQAMKDRGLYRPFTGGLFAYQMKETEGRTVRALTGLVSASEFSSGPEEPGRIIRNEDVFPAKVQERRRHIEALGHLLSPVLLVPGQAQQDYDDLLAELFAALPAGPLVADTDDRGVTHSLWPLRGSDERIGRVLDGNVFLVADGNHRSLAAQLSGSPWCLVVLASATGLRIEPYHRLLRIPGLSPDALREAITAAGVKLTAVRAPGHDQDGPADPGSYLYLGGGAWYLMSWAGPAAGADTAGSGTAGALPHSAIERLVFGAALHLDPAAKEIHYVGGQGQLGYLLGEVDARRANAALILRAVTIAEFTAINTARQQMPRKSTWFMPKARAGLIIARTSPGGGATA